jgi:hypothetical protein
MRNGSHARAHRGAGWIAGALAVVAWQSLTLAAEPCTGGIGQWNWFIGGQVTLSQDNKVRFAGNGSIPPASGTWSCDPKQGKYVVTWQNGFVDTLSLSPDGNKLTGLSSTGVQVSAGRVRAASGSSPVGSAPAGATGATSASSTAANKPSSTASSPPSSSGAPDHNPSVREILKGRPKLDPSGWKQDRSGAPQKGPKPFEGWQ